MNIYKEDLLEAVETEPLDFGSFVHAVFHYDRVGECAVCAVGALFRHYRPRTKAYRVGIASQKLTEGNNTYFDTATNWLGAVSILWEGLGNYGATVEDARVHLLDWIEDTVPEDEVLGVI